MESDMNQNISAEERFWMKVDKNGPVQSNMKTRCWVWTAAKYFDGYGVFSPKDGDPVRAHRYSWEINKGSIPAGKKILHKCDNPAYIRPGHLFLGTVRSNAIDMVRKGRSPIAKLTVSIVRRVRSLYDHGKATIPELAKSCGVSHETMRCVIRRKSWKHA